MLKKNYHSCYTRINDGKFFLKRYEKGKLYITGGTNNPFWNRMLYQNTQRNRKCKSKKKEVVNFVIFLGIKKNGIVKTKMSKNIGGRQRKNLTDNTFTSILYPAQLMSF